MTRTLRLRAGWCLALLYLACVLLPGLSLTFAADAAPCLEHAVVASVAREASGTHDAAGHHRLAAHAPVVVHDHGGHDGAHHPAGTTAAVPDTAAPAHDAGTDPPSHHTSPGPCCAMMCLSALPATPAELAAPVAVTSRCAPDIARSPTEAAPSRRDRPPMA